MSMFIICTGTVLTFITYGCFLTVYVPIGECALCAVLYCWKIKIKNSALFSSLVKKNKNVNNICIVGNPTRMNSEQGGGKIRPEPIRCHIDHQFPYHMNCACARTDPPSCLLPGRLPI